MYNSIIKKLLAGILLAILLMATTVSAFAATAQYATTQTVMDYFDEIGIKYFYRGMDDSDKECLSVSYSCDNYDSLNVILYFDPAEDEVNLRMWDIVTITAGKNYANSTVQQLNATYKYCKFVIDESDYTLRGEADLFIDKDNCGRPVYDAVRYMVAVVDDDGAAAMIHGLE